MAAWRLKPSAEIEVDRIVQRMTDGEGWLADLEKKIETIAALPGIGRARDDLMPGARSFPFKAHNIIYELAGIPRYIVN